MPSLHNCVENGSEILIGYQYGLIYYLQKQFSPSATAYMESILSKYLPCISAITQIELLSWRGATLHDEAIIRQFIQDSVVFELTDDIKEESASLRKHNGLKLPDAVIAATAKLNKLELLTRNEKDFLKVPGLTVANPWTK